MKNTTNVFLKGMTSDMHPLTISQLEYTDALNATLITFNGNELMMQNDMGNTKIQDTKTGNIMGLREGFIPVGLKEHGGIMYIASVNKDGVGEIGTIPSPVIRYNQDNPETSTPIPDEITFDSGSILSNTYRLTDVKLKPQEKFLVNIPNEYLSDVSTLTLKKYYKAKLFSKTDKSIIDISDSASTNAYYMLTGGNSMASDYWFLNLSDISSLDFDRMIALDGTKNQGGENYFIHYPNIAEGYPAIAFEKENILSFDLIENHAQNPSAVYPILLENENEYSINIYGFLFTTESSVEVDKMTVKINDEHEELIKLEYNSLNGLGSKVFAKTQLSEQDEIPKKYLLQKDNVDPDWINHIKSLPTQDELQNYPDKLLSLDIGSDCNRWFTITVDYYSNKWPDDKIGTYTFRYNPYLIDILKTNIIGDNWEPHIFSSEQTSFRLYFDVNSENEIIERPLESGNDVSSDTIISVDSSNTVKDTAEFDMYYSKFKDGETYIKFYPDRTNKVREMGWSLANDSNGQSHSYLDSSYLKLPLNIEQETASSTLLDSISFAILLKTSVHNLRPNTDYSKSKIKFKFSNFKVDNTSVWIDDKSSIEIEVGEPPTRFVSGKYYGFIFSKKSEEFSITDTNGNSISITDNSFSIKCNVEAESYNVRYLFPNIINDALKSEITIYPTVNLKKIGYSGHYVTNNASNCYVTPQFDYYVTLVQGQEESIYPGFLKDGISHVCPINSKNYLSLSSPNLDYITNNTSFRMDEIGVDLAKKIENGDTLFSDNLKGLYLLITNNPDLKFKCSIGDNPRITNPFSAFLINFQTTKRLSVYASCNSTVNLVSTGLYEINPGLLEKLPNYDIHNLGNSVNDIILNLAEYGIYLQSVCLYGEEPNYGEDSDSKYKDYWKLSDAQGGVYGNKKYEFNPLPVEGFQNIYYRCKDDEYLDKNLIFRITPSSN